MFRKDVTVGEFGVLLMCCYVLFCTGYATAGFIEMGVAYALG
jgi:hypothetical protein